MYKSFNQFRDTINNSSVKLDECRECELETMIYNNEQIKTFLLKIQYGLQYNNSNNNKT